ncbi:unnamed protein product [Thelazia callipaeda]|uniref:Very-long-chain 3-oxoacyl-CoA synthase n=1 Tax=Thelazia callipaeda TaxID=103827 RepID=A0A0N5CNU4_THECL|nr:unnamed protein product [Thelazia callipaeda]
MTVRNFVRAWLAFTVLQLIGNIWQCFLPGKFVTDKKSTAVPFLVHYWMMLILRLFVIYCFDCIPLQVFHIICSVTSVAFLSFEVFYVNFLKKSTALNMQVALSGGTVLLIISTWKYLFTATETKKKRRKTSTTMHAMKPSYINFKKQN